MHAVQPSIGRIERLRKRLQTFEQEWSQRDEKIRQLRIALVKEPSEPIKFDLTKKIIDEEQQQEAVDQSILQIEMEIFGLEQPCEATRKTNTLDNENLYNALLHLNYFKQLRSFREVIARQHAAAFLIHGAPEHGQRWLLNRLLRNLPLRTNDMVRRVTVTRKSRRIETNALWRELGGRIGLVGSYSPSEIVKHVQMCWQSQTVVLIFDQVDNLPKEYINEFIEHFWKRLVDDIPVSLPRSSDHRLLVFLLDHNGSGDKWGTTFSDVADPNRKPYTPIRLAKINRISAQVVTQWIENRFDELPATFTEQAERMVQDIMEKTMNGVPQLVLEYICNRCGCNWYEREPEWLKY